MATITQEQRVVQKPPPPVEIKEEITDAAEVELDRKALAVERDQMQTMAHEQKQRQSDFYSMLTQPYQPPAMYYERRAIQPPRNEQIAKAGKSAAVRVTGGASKEEAERLKSIVDYKERIIR